MASTFGVYPDATSLAEAVARLCEDPHPQHNGWRARCPNHQGKSDTSFSIDPIEDRVLLKCFGGCSAMTIVQALGLTMADLFVKTARRNGHRPIVKEYDYFDAYGTLVHQTVRYEPKGFSQRRPDPAHPGQWIWSIKAIRPVLYNLPAVIEAIPKGITVYVCEGEKDADTLIARGFVATTCPMGAGQWRGQYTKTLHNAHVAILPHNDLPGQTHAKKVARALTGTAATIKIVPGLWTTAERSDVSDWFQAGGTQAAFESTIAQAPFSTPTPVEDVPLTPEAQGEPWLPRSDYTNALAFVQDWGVNLHYLYPWKSWLVWNGTHWERDTNGTVMRYAKQTIKRLARTMEDLDDDAAKKLLKHIQNSLATGKLKAMLESAQSEEPIPAQPEHFDTDPWLLNCTNGTLDLRTGALRPHAQADSITKCLPIAYDAQAPCPSWMQFLWRIMGGTTQKHPQVTQAEDDRARDLIGFLQRSIGYSLTGSTREQCIFILHGPTKTGKSTFLATLRALFGPYGQQADMGSFMHKEREEVRNDLADLAGSRFVCALESQEGKRFAESLIKQLTGGTDLIKARFLFQEYFTFKPQFKIFLGTNHKPVIKETDAAIWERIRLVPFNAQIPPEEREKTLDERLQQELPGILAWAVRGCLDWQQRGTLGEPKAVIEATATYRDEQDTLKLFFDERCLFTDRAETKASVLYKAYQDWCETSGEGFPLSQRGFGLRLSERGLKPHTNNGRVWRGIGLHAADVAKKDHFDK